jgi:hypothetical protein
MGYANVNRPMGFRPTMPAGKRGNKEISRPVLATRHASTDGEASTAIAIGDAYAIDAATGGAYRAGEGDVVVGIVNGFKFQAVTDVMGGQGPISVDFIPTGVAAAAPPNIIGVEDSSAEFEVQCDTLAITDIGKKFNLEDGTPDPTYRQSRQILGVSEGTGTQFIVTDLARSPADNAFGANARATVRMLTAIEN